MPSNINTRPKFEKWAVSTDTDHIFYSGFEGVSNQTRISKTNPAYFLKALVLDWDIETSMEEILAAVEKFEEQGYITPNAMCQTKSGHARTIYVLEKPFTLLSPNFTTKVLKLLRKKLRLDRFLPALDERAYENPAIYYELGTNWLVDEASKPALTEKFMGRVMVEAAKSCSLRDMGSQYVEIPMDIVAKEVHSRFPGRWKGDFTLNARGSRFWDVDADAASAVVTSGGMLCFTGDKSFVPWVQIFGPAFVEGFLEDKIGGSVCDTIYDGKHYWAMNPISELWEAYNKDDMSLRLEVNHRLSAASIGGDPSEVKQAIVQIQNINRVQGAVPFIYVPQRIVTRNGLRFLNTSNTRVLQPEEGGPFGPDAYPWLNNYFNLMFDDPGGKQLAILLAWIQHAYCNALIGKPRKGHALFLAGDIDQGKSMFGQGLMSIVMGGHVDAAKFLKGETNFNKQLFQSGLWTVDDTTPAADQKQQAIYSSMIKKVSADSTFEYEAKHHDACMVEASPCVVITCNLDPESIRVIPAMDISNMDKLCCLQLASVDPKLKNFKPVIEMRALLERELPYWLADLRVWERPDWIEDNVRFGFKSYIHHTIKSVAHDSSDLTGFEELLTIFFKEYFRMHAKESEWTGNSTELVVQMSEDDGLKNIIGKMASNTVGRNLNKLLSTGFSIKRNRTGTKGRMWTVKREDFE